MNIAEKKLLIFDLDGTIADTLYSIMEAVNMCMKHYGFPEKSYEEVRAAVGNGAKKLIMQTMPESEAQNSERAEEIYRYFQTCYDETHDHIDGCYEGMKEAMLELCASGYTLAVLSNKPDAYVKNIIGALFDKETVVIAMGETDLPKKPDPTAPHYIARTLGFEPKDCAFIGDSEVDIRTAQNAGMLSVAVSWGFRSKETLIECAPDVIIDRPSELLEIFE
ncbi:MAG: HAD family hydrolase [Ruminococcaceae bacterium]|nr:HAD family hydrolase [Oscillospiraceae bacterium]